MRTPEADGEHGQQMVVTDERMPEARPETSQRPIHDMGTGRHGGEKREQKCGKAGTGGGLAHGDIQW